MKPIYLLPLILLLGCASKQKPKPMPTDGELYFVKGGYNFYYPPTTGSISHVTREQWEAAQGLYNGPDGANVWFNSKDGYAVLSCNKGYHLRISRALICCVPNDSDPVGDTFPPSGGAKRK